MEDQRREIRVRVILQQPFQASMIALAQACNVLCYNLVSGSTSDGIAEISVPYDKFIAAFGSRVERDTLTIPSPMKSFAKSMKGLGERVVTVSHHAQASS
jgi:hypothetical protein